MVDDDRILIDGQMIRDYWFTISYESFMVSPIGYLEYPQFLPLPPFAAG